jgi:GT2 family glycosyltransferase
VSVPTVSVIVPTFDRAHYIAQALDSLLAQTHAAHQLVVVDDGSTDETRQVVHRYGSRVQYVHQANGGKSSAVNLGLTFCDGDLVWLFDDDDVALPDAIEKRLATLASHPEAEFVWSAHYLGSEDSQRHIVRGALYDPQPPQAHAFFLEIMRSCFFHLNSALVPRRLYQQLGGLDEGLFASEDYDFQIRLARVARPVYCSSPSFIFRRHAGTRGAARIRYEESDRSAVFKRFSAKVGEKLRRTVPLGQYLVPREPGEPAGCRRQEALLNRLAVMANHGCVQAYLEDLSELVALCESGAALERPTLVRIASSYQMGWMHEATRHEWDDFISALKALSNTRHGRVATRAVGRGVLRCATRDPAHWLDRVHGAALALQVAMLSVSPSGRAAA